MMTRLIPAALALALSAGAAHAQYPIQHACRDTSEALARWQRQIEVCQEQATERFHLTITEHTTIEESNAMGEKWERYFESCTQDYAQKGCP